MCFITTLVWRLLHLHSRNIAATYYVCCVPLVFVQIFFKNQNGYAIIVIPGIWLKFHSRKYICEHNVICEVYCLAILFRVMSLYHVFSHCLGPQRQHHQVTSSPGYWTSKIKEPLYHTRNVSNYLHSLNKESLWTISVQCTKHKIAIWE